MDIMQIKTSFMRGLVAKLISISIYKKLGYKVDIGIEDISIQINDQDANVHLNANVHMKVDDLKTFTKLIDSE